jgi:carboxymethylenebutenolidase
MLFSLLVVSLAVVGVPIVGQDWAAKRLAESPRHGEWVKVNAANGRTVDAFVVYPEVAEKVTAVIVIHEIFGLTDWVRGVADQLAEHGYVAIAPDLLSGMGPDGGNSKSFAGVDDARRAIGELPPDQITSDLQAIEAYVGKLPASSGTVVVIGFCWGGSQTFRYATHSATIKAAMPFYGSGPDSRQDIAPIACPVYGFYAENDARINATLDRTAELMKTGGKTFEPLTYPGAGHGFMRAGEAPDANEANKAARQLAWARLLELLKLVR